MTTRKRVEPNLERLDRVVAEARRARDERERSYRGQALKMYPWICGRCARSLTLFGPTRALDMRDRRCRRPPIMVTAHEFSFPAQLILVDLLARLLLAVRARRASSARLVPGQNIRKARYVRFAGAQGWSGRFWSI